VSLLTTPQLFAGVEPSGCERCFYCAGQCDDSHLASDIVKPTFTGLDSVTLSRYVCRGCLVAMAEGIDITNASGELKTNQKTRGYSWIVTRNARIACTKAHRVQLLNACLVPPTPPYAICISDSGQRHLLYRTPVCWSRDRVAVTLEGEAIAYDPPQLAARIEVCKRIVAATGKPALKEPMSTQTQMRIIDHYDRDNELVAWLAVEREPLSRLAVWLCPAKEECEREYPGITRPDAKSEHRRATAEARLFD